MHVLLDQTLGIPIPPEISASIREMKLKKGRDMKEFLSKKENNRIKSSLPLLKRTLETEVEEMGVYLKKHQKVLYIFDGNTTDAQLLKRVRNWYLPETVLQLVDGAKHRAYAYYLLKLLEEGYALSSSLPPPNGFIISGRSKIGNSSYYKIGRKSKEKNFYLQDSSSGKMHKAPSPDILINNLVKLDPDAEYVAVGNIDLPTNANVSYEPLHKWAMPNSVSYLSIFPLPERSDDK
ncbi:hypothetical protein SLU01_14920 [Sporosarcina luteola]|uniref:Uncharacterized protein n=1 Tax=Sporosarcina luteola TaxID=582850 RepID=A0A511Z6Y6_9BACL|nr:hypothetical protein [Sporosarcina luteola]GEN83180.1 hypothetical protein SLU01_14920 [Sporosarcina luteola]